MAKTKKLVPKRIGGVRIPKALRRIGNKALADPRATELTAAALLALGGALVERGRLSETPLGALFGQRRAGGEARGRAATAAGGLSVGGLIDEVLDALRGDGRPAARDDKGPEIQTQDGRDQDGKDAGADPVH